MRRPVATNVRKMDGIGHLSAADPECRIAGLVSPLSDHHPGTAVFEHLRHERQFVQPSVGVQRRENLLP